MSLILDIYVQPNARKTEIVGEHDGRLKVKIASVPEDGKANTEVICFFAKQYKVPKKNVELISGHKSRMKRIKIDIDE